MSKVIAYFHIVFSTKGRANTIPLAHKKDLYGFIWALVREMKCNLVRIDGIGDHVHMLINLNPSVSLADFVKNVKAKSSMWASSDPRFPRFDGWGKGYFACSISPEDKEGVVGYVRGQEQHHYGTSFAEELERFHREAGLTFHPLDME